MKLPIAIPKFRFVCLICVFCTGCLESWKSCFPWNARKKQPPSSKHSKDQSNLRNNDNTSISPTASKAKINSNANPVNPNSSGENEEQMEDGQDLSTDNTSSPRPCNEQETLECQAYMYKMKQVLDGMAGEIDRRDKEIAAIKNKIKQYDTPQNAIYKLKKFIKPKRAAILKRDLKEKEQALIELKEKKKKKEEEFHTAVENH